MKLQSIGSKLTLWYMGMLTITFLLAGSMTYGLLVYSLSRDMDYALDSIGKIMADRVAREDDAFFPSEVDELFRRFFGFSPLERHFDIFEPSKRSGEQQEGTTTLDMPVSSNALEAAARGETFFETIASEELSPVRVLTVPVIRDGRLINVVRVGMSLENMHKTRQRFLLIMAAVFPLSLVLAGGGGWILARRALRPVDRMTQIAQKISGEHLSQRLQESGNQDELDRLARTLNEMLDRLHGAIDQMRRFSADASHELQTPLTILRGEMEVALLKDRSPQEYQEVLMSGLEEIDRINNLVEGLLLLARADSGTLRLSKTVFDIQSFLETTISQVQPLADEKDLTIGLSGSEPVLIDGDTEHLRRLMLNLFSNAIKYSHRGGTITINYSRDSSSGIIEVSDTGIGIPEKEQQLIFNRFHRVSEHRSANAADGIGLGLSIALSIVEAHNGTLEVSSTPGSGTTFTARLPLAKEIF